MMTDKLNFRRSATKELGLFLLLILMAGTIACKKDDSEVDDLVDKETDSYEFAIDIGQSQVPYIVIDTRGSAIKNEPKIPAMLKVFVEKEEVKSVNIGIEYRGSTSFRISDKKSFGIETWDENGEDISESFFGFPEEEDWILMGHIVNLTDKYIWDRTLMYHYIGYEWSWRIGRYASRGQFVELELNGVYQGVYVFMEKLKRDGDRINVQKTSVDDITGGYVLKIDKTAGGAENIGQPLEYFLSNWGDDARYTALNSFRSTYDVFGNVIDFEPYGEPYHPQQYQETYFLYDYPKADDITQVEKDYIKGYIEQFEAALLRDNFDLGERSYADYIDIDSFVDYLLLTELCRNVDGYRLSTYLQKDAGGKLGMGPIWDLNIGYDGTDRVPLDGWVYNYNEYAGYNDAWLVPFWWTRLMQDVFFRQAIKIRWQLLRSNELSNSNLLQSIDETANYLQNNGAVTRNFELWDQGIGVDYAAGIQSLKEYVEARLQWMDSQIDQY